MMNVYVVIPEDENHMVQSDMVRVFASHEDAEQYGETLMESGNEIVWTLKETVL